MATEFITARYPDRESVKTQTRSQMRQRVHNFIPSGVQGRLREEGGEYGRWRREFELVERVLDRADRMGVGPRLLVQRQNDHEVLSIREVTATPELGAAPAIEVIHGLVWAKFDCRSGGLWYCRFIDGTHDVSKHGYLKRDPNGWKGAAEDVFPMGPDANAAGLEKVAAFVIAETKAGRAQAEHVIWLQRIWEPGVGEHVYSGQTHYHVHIDVAGGGPCSP